MNRKTLTALKSSIKKWERIVAGTGVDEGRDNCSLCASFYHKRAEVHCIGCPVREKTGHGVCFNTPYMSFIMEMATAYSSGKATTPAAKKAARAEVRFLKSLLPNPNTRRANI